jgi:predicted transcriptional regulator
MECISQGPMQPTMLSRRTGLPWEVVKEILEGLVSVDCLTTEKIGKRMAYRLTKKGRYAYLKLREITLELSPILEPSQGSVTRG